MPALKTKLKRAALSVAIVADRHEAQQAGREATAESRAVALIDAAAGPAAKLAGKAPKAAKGEKVKPDRLDTLLDDGRFVIVYRSELVAALMPRK